MSGKYNDNWPDRHTFYIEQWNQRDQSLPPRQDITPLDLDFDYSPYLRNYEANGKPYLTTTKERGECICAEEYYYTSQASEWDHILYGHQSQVEAVTTMMVSNVISQSPDFEGGSQSVLSTPPRRTRQVPVAARLLVDSTTIFEFERSRHVDVVSDSVMSLVLNITREIPKIVVESEDVKTEEENGKKAEKVIQALLFSLFGDVKLGENGKVLITVDGNVAHLDKQSGDVESENEGLKERVKTAFR
ncbi:hypothetical protein F3Y22_tig00011761pilonHSYRG00179 [Hibiscus syriacus]|uniref:Pre-mRNA 3'-end-processing endonuclease polyadenylation factor C-term domain-containing protein n=1 Tax=Hibiscus syriacus TaxID=106335 RepID=A0A6A3C9C2_HIBSY|nr:hypothetical protein F3Y22_tig00011761pilonHSYRG00179 [Hibiscus syriacus]